MTTTITPATATRSYTTRRDSPGCSAVIVPFDLSPVTRSALSQVVVQHRSFDGVRWVDAVRSDADLRAGTDREGSTPLIAWYVPTAEPAADRRALIPHDWTPPVG